MNASTIEDILYNTIQNVFSEAISNNTPPPRTLYREMQNNHSSRQRERRYNYTNTPSVVNDEPYLENISMLSLLREMTTEYNANIRQYSDNVHTQLQIIRHMQEHPQPRQEQGRANTSFANRRSPRYTSSASATNQAFPLPEIDRNRRPLIHQRQPTRHVIFSDIFSDENPRPTEEEINRAIRIIPFENNPLNIAETQCPITLENFQEGEPIGQLIHCGHVFREPAIRSWLRRTYACPICRHDIRQTSSTNATATATTTLLPVDRTIPMDSTIPMDRVFNTTEIDRLLGSISNGFSELLSRSGTQDASMNMIFTFPYVFYDTSGVTTVTTVEMDVDTTVD